MRVFFSCISVPFLSTVISSELKTSIFLSFSFDSEYRRAYLTFLATNHTMIGVSFLLFGSLMLKRLSPILMSTPSSIPHCSTIFFFCSSCALVSASCIPVHKCSNFLLYCIFRCPLTSHKDQYCQFFVNPFLPVSAVQTHDKLRNHAGSLGQRILL